MSSPRIPIWGGFECSIVRIADAFRDQIAETSHATRDSDLGLVSDLGISTLRYGILWEHVAPHDLKSPSWRWVDQQMSQIRAQCITPIVGLLHHGSGPRYTNLLDPGFPYLLAQYAGMVAARYPWVEHFTPINEPLTTARFSCLYGHWYPHLQDEAAFLRAVFNQVYGVVLSMRAVRKVNPQAQLIQTEEIGRVFATGPLTYQADYENERRWLSLDLLFGRVTSAHPWFAALVSAGVREELLRDVSDSPCIPNVVGVNFYLSSDRYLDHRLASYPVGSHGGNGRDAYADVEAARTDEEGACDIAARLIEASQRYDRPLAVTEVHNGCTREEQIRWIVESYKGAQRAACKGADIRGLTVWALAGSVDWRSLLTKREGLYESGALDVRGGVARRTALCGAVAALASQADYDHPVLDAPGWWHRDMRFFRKNLAKGTARLAEGRRLLIVGASGTLGQAFARLCHLRGLIFRASSRCDLDIADEASVERAIDRYRPWAIINAAGYVRVNDAENEREKCFRDNSQGAATLARSCARHGIQLVTFSSDLVFDGRLGRAYVETDLPTPTGVYGESKASAERQVSHFNPQALIVRTSAFFGPWDRYSFIHSVLASLKEGRQFRVRQDATVSPTYVPDLVDRVLDLLIDGESGVWHLVNEGALSWGDLARSAARYAGLDNNLIVVGRDGKTSTALSSERGPSLPTFAKALGRYFRERDLPRSKQVG
jgi:dTDP-4-dehydrorhamnose reductase